MNVDFYTFLLVLGIVAVFVGVGILIQPKNVGLPRGYICIPKEAWDEQMAIEHELTQRCERMEGVMRNFLESMPKVKAENLEALSEMVEDGQIKVSYGAIGESGPPYKWVDAGVWLLDTAERIRNEREG